MSIFPSGGKTKRKRTKYEIIAEDTELSIAQVKEIAQKMKVGKHT